MPGFHERNVESFYSMFSSFLDLVGKPSAKAFEMERLMFVARADDALKQSAECQVADQSNLRGEPESASFLACPSERAKLGKGRIRTVV